ncbi:Zinc finger protein [Toxocara canis]|uniref:Zinc finger protein 830 n=1 Tax=Toxocara canis TaxID=6265 RepID=A0A0B2VYS2_TOXCA|nr:Zinc finger protein [Toxocara canis]
MSVPVVNVNPAIAKDMKNGNLLCMICNSQVKSKIWTAHSNGRKHRENIELLKKRHAAAQKASKRPYAEEHPQPSSSLPVKKHREERIDHEIESFTPAQTPWQRGGKSNVSKLRRPIPKNVIEGVPEGFFDDEKLNSRVVDDQFQKMLSKEFPKVVETIEKQATMEQEYANFLSELNEAKQEEEEREDIEEQTSAIEHDIEHIDEQINHWKRVNRLELRRDEIYKSTTAKESEPTRTAKEMEVTSDDEEKKTKYVYQCFRYTRYKCCVKF